MRKHSNRDSVLQGNFCDIVNFFRGRDIDDVDRLAQRALTIIMSTDHLVQTGDEVNTDPFCANMFASTALGMLNEHLTTYPFVRDPLGNERCHTTADEDAVIASAEDMLEMAEGLMWPEPSFLDGFDATIEATGHQFFDQLLPSRELGVKKDALLTPEEIARWRGTEPVDVDAARKALESGLSNSRFLVLTDGFKNEGE